MISGFSWEITRSGDGGGLSWVVTGPLTRAMHPRSSGSITGCVQVASSCLAPWCSGICNPCSDPRWHLCPAFLAPHRTHAPGWPWTVCAMMEATTRPRIAHWARSCRSPGMWMYIVLRPAAFMRGELTLAGCLLPPILPIKNILPSRSARSSPGPQLYFINTFRQVQKGMIHAGPEHS